MNVAISTVVSFAWTSDAGHIAGQKYIKSHDMLSPGEVMKMGE